MNLEVTVNLELSRKMDSSKTVKKALCSQAYWCKALIPQHWEKGRRTSEFKKSLVLHSEFQISQGYTVRKCAPK